MLPLAKTDLAAWLFVRSKINRSPLMVLVIFSPSSLCQGITGEHADWSRFLLT